MVYSFLGFIPTNKQNKKEEEEGTGIASDVVKVKSEDPATPRYHLRSADTRKPRDRNESPISG